jgi:hypothetical protein
MATVIGRKFGIAADANVMTRPVSVGRQAESAAGRLRLSHPTYGITNPHRCRFNPARSGFSSAY